MDKNSWKYLRNICGRYMDTKNGGVKKKSPEVKNFVQNNGHKYWLKLLSEKKLFCFQHKRYEKQDLDVKRMKT